MGGHLPSAHPGEFQMLELQKNHTPAEEGCDPASQEQQKIQIGVVRKFLPGRLHAGAICLYAESACNPAKKYSSGALDRAHGATEHYGTGFFSGRHARTCAFLLAYA